MDNFVRALSLEETISERVASEFPHVVFWTNSSVMHDADSRSWLYSELGTPAVNCLVFPIGQHSRQWEDGRDWALWANNSGLFYALREYARAVEFKLRFG